MKRVLFTIVALLALETAAAATCGIIQEVPNQDANSSTSGTTIALPSAITITAGSIIVVRAQWDQTSGQTGACADPTNGSYGTAIDSLPSGTKTSAEWNFVGAAAGTYNITCTFSAATVTKSIFVTEIGGCAALVGHAAQLQTAPGGGTDLISSGSATPSSQPGLALGFTSNNITSTTLAAGTSYTMGTQGIVWQNIGRTGAAESKRIASTSALAATFTDSANPSADRTFIAIYSDSGGGGGGAGGAGGAGGSGGIGGAGGAGGISLIVSPSRSSCAAPCEVFFDATGTTGLAGSAPTNDWVRAQFRWNFDSTGVAPSDPHQKTIGFVTAHVFKTAGTYSVTTSVIDSSGVAAGPTTTTITVSAMSGTTFYAASAGSGSTCSIGSPCSLSTALGHVATNNTILLRNGDSWTSLSTISIVSITGPVLIGGYSDPGSPSVVLPSLAFNTSGVNAFDIHGSTQISLQGIKIVSSPAATTTIAYGFGGACSDLLMDSVEIDGNDPTFVGNDGIVNVAADASKYVIVDSYMHNFDGGGVFYASPTQMAVIGTTISNYVGNHSHALRFQGCTETSPGVCDSGDHMASVSYSAENTISVNSTPTPFEPVTWRGDNAKIVWVNNTTNGLTSLQPQNTSSVEFVQDALIEGNFSNGGYNFIARHVVARNNVINNSQNPFTATNTPTGSGGLGAGWTDQIHILNNVALYIAASTPGFTSFVTHSSTTGSVTIQNNIFYNGHPHDSNGQSQFLTKDGTGTEVENHNLAYLAVTDAGWTPLSGTGDLNTNPLLVSTSPTVATDMSIQSSSPAKYAGTTVPAYSDYAGTSRPVGPNFSIGAFEPTATLFSPNSADLLMCL